MMNEQSNDFVWLQKWYHSHCDGDWEHDCRIHISTIDNPGWSVMINLENTELEEKKFNEIDIEISPDNWLICFIKNRKFEGCGGPVNLPEIFRIFRNWAENEPE
jgi:hypothetical protein